MKIEVKRDPSLVKPKILVRNQSPYYVNGQQRPDIFAEDQVNAYGVMVPIITINGKTLDFRDVIHFELNFRNMLPELYLEFHDPLKKVSLIDNPNVDHFVNVQILPPFEGAYKKINLMFYVKRISHSGDYVTLSCLYKVKKLINKQFKGLGQLTTFELYDLISKETEIGFATNIKATDDKRYMYCDYISYAELLQRETERCYADETTIIEGWIDPWDYLNIVNIYERANTIENLDPRPTHMWIMPQVRDIEKNEINKPKLVPRHITNSLAVQGEQIFAVNYEIINGQGGQPGTGTDKVFSAYMLEKGEYEDTLIQDGDVKKDIYYNFEYLGECYGDYNYLIAEQCKKAYEQKLGLEKIRVLLKSPLLGLIRGEKVNFSWYVNDERMKDMQQSMAEDGLLTPYDSIETNIDTYESKPGPPKDNGEFQLDKTITGQYCIDGTLLEYRDGQWYYYMDLIRPIAHKPKILNKSTIPVDIKHRYV